MEKKEMQICPKCGCTYTERPALSRVDNKTAICPTCGTMEALASIVPQQQVPKSRGSSCAGLDELVDVR